MTQIRRCLYLGSFVPAALAFARSCHARGIQFYVLQTGAPWPVRSAAVAGHEHLNTDLIFRPEGIGAIREHALKVRADALLTLSEAHGLWLSREREAFTGVAKVLLPPHETLRRLRSKLDQLALAKTVGLEALPTYVLRTVRDAEAVPTKEFPLCLRPSAGGAVEPMFKVEMADSPDDLRRRLEASRIADSILAQPYRALPTLVVHCVRSEKGDRTHVRAFLADRKFAGISLRLRRAAIEHSLGDRLIEFGDRAGLTGAYHFELLYDAAIGRTYFLEVNPRLGGSTDKVLRMDFDEPALCLEAYGYDVPPLPRGFRTRRSRVVNKRVILKHIQWALQGKLGPLDYPPLGKFRHVLNSVSDLVMARDSIADRRDWAGTLSYHLSAPNRTDAP